MNMKKMLALLPINFTSFTERIQSALGVLADLVAKRVGGGRVQMGLMTFLALAKSLIPNESGYDKQSKTDWVGQDNALKLLFGRRGWPLFDRAVVIAVIHKWAVDPKGGFIPLDPNSIDIEAKLSAEVGDLQKECVIYGTSGEPDASFAEKIAAKIGITTEYGNGDSIELVVPFYSPGDWKRIADNGLERRTGIIIVTPALVLYCEEMNICGIQRVPWELMSCKVLEAIKIAQQLCRECDIE